MQPQHSPLRWASRHDAETVARLLHDFNTEFAAPSPGREVLASRLRRLLDGPTTLALLAGESAYALALLTLRTNVWFERPVALLDEFYVEPTWRRRGLGTLMIDAVARRLRELGVELLEVNVDDDDTGARHFYEAHGFQGIDPDSGCPAYYYSRDL